MKLLFKQRFFSWLDSYTIFYENGETAYTVESEMDFTHNLHIYDASNKELGSIRQKFFAWMPTFELYVGDTQIGSIKKRFEFFSRTYDLEGTDWVIEGDFMEWDYTIATKSGQEIATISKELWNWTDTYSIDVKDPKDALLALMFVLALDAEKCSRG